MIVGMMHWRDEKVARKERPSHTVRYLKELLEKEQRQQKSGWDEEPKMMSPEEQEEEMLAYQRHRERQRRSAAGTLPSPDYRKTPTK